ncbi:hypothetical protein Runsl_5695 (plasmid) [Runella slithyformis DSM 19594]|uniref:Uncharacterized protein n=1 Tax=Runella slithyformis (strain ATCC 29530 / DSM 19594 / LMG 11500 / NCIMB 11436 / LSU 4) TaxID=761193 RepID=A0A7U4E8Z4_RUNSL|nr:hypothetical protein Runsl_5695 [Runella slithyformis DSM 19594]
MQDCKVRISSVGTAAVAYHSSYREKQGNRQTAAGTTSPIFKAYQRQNSGDCSPLSNNYSKLIELNHRMCEVSRVVRTESKRSFKISSGTGMSTNWRFLRLNRSRVSNRQMNSYKSFNNTRIGPIYDGFRADSLLKSYNFSEALETDPNGNVTTINGSSFSILEQTKCIPV